MPGPLGNKKTYSTGKKKKSSTKKTRKGGRR